MRSGIKTRGVGKKGLGNVIECPADSESEMGWSRLSGHLLEAIEEWSSGARRINRVIARQNGERYELMRGSGRIALKCE